MHPLRERRTYLVLLVTCLAAGIGGWTLGSVRASETAFYIVGVTITGVGTAVAILGASRFRRD